MTIPANKLFEFVDRRPVLCGSYHQKVYFRSSTGNIDYPFFDVIADRRLQHIAFMFKEIHIEETGAACVSTEENEQCIANCLNRKLFNTISCRLPYMPEADLPFCLTSSSVRQAHLAFRNLFFVFGATKDCNCLPKCRTRFLEVTHFVKDLDIGYTHILFGSGDNVVESYVITRAYPLVKLLCDIGGLLGSSLGLCLLGMVEIALSYAADRFKKHKRQLRA